MGLFTRKEATSSRRQAQRPRPSVSSEAQAASMRVRARRRLAGAVALVLAAVILLPMLLDGEPRPVPTGIQIDVPKTTDPFNPDLSASQAGSTAASSGSTSDNNSVSSAQQVDAASQTVPSTTAAASSGTSESASVDVNSTQQAAKQPSQSPATAASDAPTKPQVKSATADNTAVAMAILEGRKPAATSAANAKPASSGFLVQIASYSTQGDADSRRDKLASQGITNAFVESASVNGKSTYRLRVGPFESRDAAQAAQTRLRTLGYGDGMIMSK